MRRAFDIDALRCECGAEMVVLAMIMDARVLERILTHLGRPAAPPPIAPARLAPQSELVFDDHPPDDAYLDEPAAPQGQLADSRAPP